MTLVPVGTKGAGAAASLTDRGLRLFSSEWPLNSLTLYDPKSEKSLLRRAMDLTRAPTFDTPSGGLSARNELMARAVI